MEESNEIKNRIEAILFSIGSFIDVEELARICSIGSTGLVKDYLIELKRDYQERNTALELVEEDNRWKLNIKGKYGHIANKILSDSELDSPTMKTLAVIAYKQPIEQSKLIKARGNSAYQHIKQLKEQNFITSEPSGRTRILKLSKTFYDYFDVNKDEIKARLEHPAIKEDLGKLPG